MTATIPVANFAFGSFIGPPPKFAGTPGTASCYGQSIAALVRQFGGLNGAAAALGYLNIAAPQSVILAYCGFIFGYLRRPDRDQAQLVGVSGLTAAGLLTLALLKIYPIDGGRIVLFFSPFAVVLVMTGFVVCARSTRLVRR